MTRPLDDEHGEWTIENQTAGQQIDISSPNGITLDGYSLSCNQNYELFTGPTNELFKPNYQSCTFV